MFHFPSFASGTYGFSAGSRGFAAGGFPIRKSPGQGLLGGSPELIAACHVLHRLLTPGHPPCALIRLTTTQRMKKFRTHSQDRLSKNPGRVVAGAPISKSRNFLSSPPSLLAPAKNIASELPPLPCGHPPPVLALQRTSRRGNFHATRESWWR